MSGILRVTGFHGTSAATAERILATGFTVSRNEWDWLGDGVYFFQDAPLRAWRWAREHYPGSAAVVGAEIRLEDCMDLLDVRWSSVLAEAYDSFIRRAKESELPLPRQTSGAHRLDRAVINYIAGVLADQGTPIRAVRGAFSEGGPIFPDSALHDRSHVQVAVRDLSLIGRVWLEAEGR